MKNLINSALILASFISVSANAENFKKNHPRRAQVNHAARAERREVKKDVESGKITKEQGAQDLKNIHDVKVQERADVKANGGYLTKDQKKGLNSELRDNQKNIKSQVNGNAAQTTAPVAPVTPASN